MTVKISFFFNSYKQGFSETYYSPVTNPALLVTSLSPQLLTSITQFRTISTLLYAVRGTEIEPPFRSFTRLIRGAYQGGQQSDPDASPDVVSTTAVIQLVSENATKRRVFLRGLPDNYVKRDDFGNDLFIGEFKTMVTKMVAQLIGNGFAVRKQVKPPLGALAYAPVRLLGPDPVNGRFTRITYSNTVGFNPVVHGKVVCKGTPNNLLPNFPRIATVVEVIAGAPISQLVVLYGVPGGVPISVQKMVVSNLLYTYEAISEFTFERFSSHKTGRPFGQLAGKKRGLSAVR